MSIRCQIPLYVVAHEASHAVCAIVVARGMRHRAFDYVEVFPDQRVGQRGLLSLSTDCCALPDDAEAIMALAGPIGQNQIARQSEAVALAFGGRSDFERSCESAGRWYRSRGGYLPADETKRQLILGSLIEKLFIPPTKRLVRKHWSRIRSLADELRTKQRIDHDEVRTIIGL